MILINFSRSCTLSGMVNRFFPIYFLLLLSSCNFIAQTDMSSLGDRDSNPPALDACYVACPDADFGDACGGGVFAGEYDGDILVVTPGNCTNDTMPFCDGGVDTDSLRFDWGTPNNRVTDALDAEDGRINIPEIFSSGHDTTPAATFCDDMIYGGCDDWYLPAKNELLHLYNNRAAVGGFNLDRTYWSSTDHFDNISWAYRINFSNGTTMATSKNLTTADILVRCVRRLQ